MNAIDLRFGRWQDVLRDVPDASVRLVLTSPPYDNARTYEDVGAEPVDFRALGEFCLRVLKPGGVLVMVLDGAVNKGVSSTTPYKVICLWAEMPGWHLSQVLAYGRHGAPGQYAYRFRRDHEPVIVMHKDGAKPVCNKDVLATPSKGRMRPGGGAVRTREGGFAPFGCTKAGKPRVVRQIRHRGSVWWYGAVGHGQDPSCNTGHPATFAERFARDAIAVWSHPGDVVCDPFSGSGTVAKACQDLARCFVGAEVVRKYHEIALRRCSDPAVDGGRR